MSTPVIVIIVIAIIIVAVIAMRSGGPRVTTITREREVKHEDRDDA